MKPPKGGMETHRQSLGLEEDDTDQELGFKWKQATCFHFFNCQDTIYYAVWSSSSETSHNIPAGETWIVS